MALKSRQDVLVKNKTVEYQKDKRYISCTAKMVVQLCAHSPMLEPTCWETIRFSDTSKHLLY